MRAAFKKAALKIAENFPEVYNLRLNFGEKERVHLRDFVLMGRPNVLTFKESTAVYYNIYQEG